MLVVVYCIRCVLLSTASGGNLKNASKAAHVFGGGGIPGHVQLKTFTCPLRYTYGMVKYPCATGGMGHQPSEDVEVRRAAVFQNCGTDVIFLDRANGIRRFPLSSFHRPRVLSFPYTCFEPSKNHKRAIWKNGAGKSWPQGVAVCEGKLCICTVLSRQGWNPLAAAAAIQHHTTVSLAVARFSQSRRLPFHDETITCAGAREGISVKRKTRKLLEGGTPTCENRPYTMKSHGFGRIVFALTTRFRRISEGCGADHSVKVFELFIENIKQSCFSWAISDFSFNMATRQDTVCSVSKQCPLILSLTVYNISIVEVIFNVKFSYS
jgi:hypothetical protein